MATFLENPEKGRDLTAYFGGEQKLSDRFIAGASYNLFQMRTFDNTDEYYSGYLASMRLNYQYNKAISFRLIGQYNNFDQSFQIQPLLSYQPNPFTLFYIGTTNNQIDWEVSQSQAYVKFQYLIN